MTSGLLPGSRISELLRRRSFDRIKIIESSAAKSVSKSESQENCPRLCDSGAVHRNAAFPLVECLVNKNENENTAQLSHRYFGRLLAEFSFATACCCGGNCDRPSPRGKEESIGEGRAERSSGPEFGHRSRIGESARDWGRHREKDRDPSALCISR